MQKSSTRVKNTLVQARAAVHVVKYTREVWVYTDGVKTRSLMNLFTTPWLIGKLESIVFRCKLQFFNIAAEVIQLCRGNFH